MNDKYLIEKSNILNNFKCKPRENMTLNELRFFCMYVSRLNPCDPQKREVEIKLKEFEEMFKIKINTTEFKGTIERILSRIMYIYDEQNKKHRLINLYSMFEWTDAPSDSVKISANYDIIPYLWDLQSNYTVYKIGNIAKLNSVSKIRFYEILTQYKKIGFVQFDIEEIKELVQSKQKDFYEFNRNTLTPALKAINEHTDITVTYEKVLKCRKCVSIKFYIKSKEQQKVIEFAETVEQNTVSELVEPVQKWNGFTTDEEDELYDYIRRELKNIYKSAKVLTNRTETIYNNALAELKKHSGVKHHKAYIKKIIDTLLAEEQKKPKKEEKRRSYDINQFEKFAINYPELQKVENGEVSESHFEPVLEPVKETKVICQEEIEKPVIEPVSVENEDVEKMFDETEEGKTLFSKIVEALTKFEEYSTTVSVLDLISKDWRKYGGFCKGLIIDKLKEKENAPEIIDVFE